MKTKFKSKLLGVLLVLVMVLALVPVSTLTAYALDSITGVQLSSEGRLTWNSFPTANDYLIVFNGVDIHTDGNTYCDIEDYAVEHDWTNGTYNWSIQALSSGDPCSEVYEGTYTLTKMINVSVNDGVLSWDAFPGAAGYEVLFGPGGGYCDELSYDFETKGKELHLPTGTYNWTVHAVDGDDNKISANKKGTYSFTNTQTSLATPNGLAWDHATTTWEAVANADRYVVELWEVGNSGYSYRQTVTTNYFTFPVCLADTEYYFKVKAFPNVADLDHLESEYATSVNKTFASVVPSLTNVTINAKGELSFDAVAGASIYDIEFFNQLGISQYGGSVYQLPVDMYNFATGLSDGLYDIKICVRNEYKEPLAPVYVYEDWYYDSSLAPQPLTGSVEITGNLKYGETVTAVATTNNTGTLQYVWYRKNPATSDVSAVHNSLSNTFVITEECVGQKLLVIVSSSVEKGQLQSEDTGVIAKADGPAAPTVGKTDCTTIDNNDGTITGVNDTMEYKLSTGDWADVEGTSVTGLTNGTYYVRVKATNTHEAGAQATVTIAAYVAPEKYSITMIDGVAKISDKAVSESSQGITVTVIANAAPSGYQFAGWTCDDVTFANVSNTTTTFVMPAKAVVVRANYSPLALTGTVTISGTKKFGETLTANVTDSNNSGTLSYQWKRGVDDIDGANSATYTLVAADVGRTLRVVVTSNLQTGSIQSEVTSEILRADGPAAPSGFTTTACTTNANNDGTISGILGTMEYKLSSAGEWTDGTGTTVENLVAGTYNVRIKQTATHFASASANVVVGAYEAPELYSVTVNGGTADPVSAEEGEIVTITANAPAAHMQFDRWTTADGITFADESSATTTFVLPAGNVTITATYKPIKHTVSFNNNGGSGTKDTEQVNEASLFDLPANPFTAPEGKKFDGWALSATGAKIESTSIQVDNDVELFAVWVNLHEHSMQAVPAREATCTVAGNTAYWHCTGCDKYFSDALGNTEINLADTVIPALGHDFGEWTVITPATETTEGLERRVCSRDASHVQERSIPMIGHVHTIVAVPAKEATCLEKGESAHYECSGCHHFYSDELGANEINAEDFEIPALGHDFGEWMVTTPAQVGVAGVETRVCSRDENHKETRQVPALDPAPDSDPAPVNPDNPNNTPDNPNNTPDDPSDDKDGLGAGAIVGIVIGSVAVAGVGGFALFWFVIKKKTWADFLAIFKKK